MAKKTVFALVLAAPYAGAREETRLKFIPAGSDNT
jgi:hypothetical protein